MVIFLIRLFFFQKNRLSKTDFDFFSKKIYDNEDMFSKEMFDPHHLHELFIGDILHDSRGVLLTLECWRVVVYIQYRHADRTLRCTTWCTVIHTPYRKHDRLHLFTVYRTTHKQVTRFGVDAERYDCSGERGRGKKTRAIKRCVSGLLMRISEKVEKEEREVWTNHTI